MEVLRTPDNRFDNLPGFPFEPHYIDISDGDGGVLRVAYIDEGPSGASPVLLMHGEPSWSYLYRHMIPILVDAGHRVIAPDLVGFGRSDKPAAQNDYTFARHVDWMRAVLHDHLDLTDVTLFAQDWGGLIGLRLLADAPERYARVAIGNTGLPDGHGTPSDAFLAWQKFSQESPNFNIGPLINMAIVTDLPADVIAAYDAPFPDDTFMAGARIFPALVPTSRDDPAIADNDAAWRVLEQFDKPFLLCFSDSDPITAGGDAVFLRRVPGTNGQPHTTIEGAGHFFQEDKGPVLAELVNTFIADTSGS